MFHLLRPKGERNLHLSLAGYGCGSAWVVKTEARAGPVGDGRPRSLDRACDPRALEPALAARLRAAQFEAATHHSILLLSGNLFNALVILAVAAEGPHLVSALAWGGALLVFLSPAVLSWSRGAPPAEPRAVSPRAVAKFVRNAGLLGLLWGLSRCCFSTRASTRGWWSASSRRAC